jgi:diaminopimelate epimerase
MRIDFTKMHGLGNDFVFVDDLDGDLGLEPDAVRAICARHTGVGADGLIAVQRDTSGEGYYMHYFNADGSLAEMCGNGARCFVKYLGERGLLDDSPAVFGTLGGVRRVEFDRGENGLVDSVRVDMGVPVLAPADIPADFEGDMVYECPVETALGVFAVTVVSMGNPHAVIWLDDGTAIEDAPVATVGPALETHPAFPAKTNVEFAQRVSEDRIRLRVWERGVGETLACGTGACATLVASVLGCRTGRRATVALPGGELDIEWGDDEHVYMTGPATESFTGVIEV